LLVVEDDPDIRGSLVGILELEGHTVKAVADGAGALMVLGDWQPDIALVDIGIPGMNGYELARAIRARPSGKHLPLIALTGYGRPGDREAALEAGFDLHLTKPFNPDELEDVFFQFQDRIG
jgi:CheY-like chemotaxis protein